MKQKARKGTDCCRHCKPVWGGLCPCGSLKTGILYLGEGRVCGCGGESGSGKSTLLNCIGGLDRPDSGKVCLDGNDIFSMNENKRTLFRRRNIGFIFQSFQLVAELTVEQNMIFSLLLDYRKPDQKAVEEMLEVLYCAGGIFSYGYFWYG